jgi:4-amino-4-deoxy-L-arabinose transferase-like glycosyltransferase
VQQSSPDHWIVARIVDMLGADIPHRGSGSWPAWTWPTALTVAWVVVGLVGHDPWKADEAHTFGVVVDFLRLGDWVVPSLAGEPFMEKPPLFYIVAAACAQLFGVLLPLHDAARLASGFFVGIALLFLGLTAREIHGRGYACVTLLVFISCFGTFARLHQMVTDVALLAGLAIGIFGLALARRTLWSASAALGAGAAVAFLGKGLLGPGLLGLTALLLPLYPLWRTRRYMVVLCVAASLAVVPAALWMSALYARSPDLFHEWLVINNFGRFFGFTRIGPHAPPGYYAYTLLWYAFPALPLAGLALWNAWRRPAIPDASRGVELPLMLTVVVGSVLGLASDSRELYLLPLMLPLSLLAAKGVERLPLAGARAVSNGARWGMGAIASSIWLSWLVLVAGEPEHLQSLLLAYQPGFAAKVNWIHVGLASIATVVAAAAMLRPARSSVSALKQWAVGLTLCWTLLATLWVPYFDAGKSYRSMIVSLVPELRSGGCVASWHLGEPQRGMLEYFARISTERLESLPDAKCKALLVQGWRSTGAPAPTPDWIAVWEGARPGDRKELYRLYRRDVTPGQATIVFP